MRITTVVIGAGHAGLAMSHCLTSRSIDHVVLERGEVANSWKTERWDSLRLLTPNWQSRLPGYGYEGDDPDGFRTMPETIDFLERYAGKFGAPVQSRTAVTAVTGAGEGFRVSTEQGDWHCRTVVIATGACNIPCVPAVAAALPPGIETFTTREYRNPGQIPEGGVLVVGASASGTQIAEELHLSGRPVTLAVGEHIRAPRVYRGRDIEWWMDAAGVMEDRYDEQDDIARARKVPSLQLAGSAEGRRTVDLNRLTSLGVRLVGRLAGIHEGRAQFSGSLRNQCEMSDLKMNRLLDRIDEWAIESGLDSDMPPPHRFDSTRVEDAPPLGLDLTSGEIKTVLWATGYRPDYSWLEVPVLDRKGRIKHDGGVIECPGLYVMGIPFLRRRKSALIDGAGDDARDLSTHLAEYLDQKGKPPLSRNRATGAARARARPSSRDVAEQPLDTSSTPGAVMVHLIDGTYELFRHFYGLRRFNKGRDKPYGAVAGVLTTVLQMFEQGATHLGVATDHVIESFRNNLWPGYKTSAGMDRALLAQFKPLEEALAAMGVTVWPMVELEADDALASAATITARDKSVQKICIWTPDKDLAQCVRDDHVVQVDRKTQKIRNADGVREKFGVGPELIADYLALVGDSADGYPGIAGIGAVSAARLLRQHGPIESLPPGVLGQKRKLALLFKDLATLRTNAPLFQSVDELRWRGPTAEFPSWAERMGASRLLERCRKLT